MLKREKEREEGGRITKMGYIYIYRERGWRKGRERRKEALHARERVYNVAKQ